MNLPKLVSLGIALLFIQACSHPIEIEGEGNVMSASGTRTCLFENFQAGDDVCSKNYAIGAYQETYYPTAEPGWKFDHWVTYCTTATPPNYECVFDVSAATVQQFWGQTMPPLKAVFTMDGISITDFVTVNDKQWAQTDVLSNTSWDELNAACPPPTHACAGVVSGVNLNGWTWASVEEVNTLFNHFIGSVELGEGPDGFTTPGEYDLWTQFIAAGWHMNSISPGGVALFRGWTSTQVDTDYVYIGTVALREPYCDFETAVFPNYTCTGSSTEVLTNQTRPKNGVQFDPNAQDIWPAAVMGTWLYRAAPGTPITGDNVVIANGKEWAQVDLFLNLPFSQVALACPAGVCLAGAVLNGYDMTGWELAHPSDLFDLVNTYLGVSVWSYLNPIFSYYDTAPGSWWALSTLFRYTYPNNTYPGRGQVRGWSIGPPSANCSENTCPAYAQLSNGNYGSTFSAHWGDSIFYPNSGNPNFGADPIVGYWFTKVP